MVGVGVREFQKLSLLYRNGHRNGDSFVLEVGH